MKFMYRFLPQFFKNKIKLILDYCYDYYLFSKESTIFKADSLENKQTLLILNYHGIEKGFLNKQIKPRFAKDRIQAMHNYLKDPLILKNIDKSQIYVAYKVACEYYEFHKKNEIDISDYFTEDQYRKYVKLTENIDSHDFLSSTKKISYSDLYRKHNNFDEFSNSRKSIRFFTGEKISIETVKDVIKLANNSPSVCNRQASKVYLLEDKEKIDECLKIQGGFNGYIHHVSQILILTVDRKYFYITGERYQFYIDGGIYLLNLLYSLHYHKIAACPANWAKDFISDRSVRKIVEIPESEQIICMIPIGIATEEITVTLSYRRTVDEVLRII